MKKTYIHPIIKQITLGQSPICAGSPNLSSNLRNTNAYGSEPVDGSDAW